MSKGYPEARRTARLEEMFHVEQKYAAALVYAEGGRAAASKMFHVEQLFHVKQFANVSNCGDLFERECTRVGPQTATARPFENSRRVGRKFNSASKGAPPVEHLTCCSPCFNRYMEILAGLRRSI